MKLQVGSGAPPLRDDGNVWPQEMLKAPLSFWKFLWQYINYLLKIQMC